MKLIKNETKVIIRTKDHDSGLITETNGIFVDFEIYRGESCMIILASSDKYSLGKKNEFVVLHIPTWHIYIPEDQP